MLTRLKVNGFKNLVNVDVRFGPFTCVAGVNGSGKSNLFDAIMFLAMLADRPLVDAALSVRAEGGRMGDVRSLFHRVRDSYDSGMTLETEMIIPAEGEDDLGQKAGASLTFLRYSLTLAYRTDSGSHALGPLEIMKEELVRIRLGDARSALLFPHSRAWRESVLRGRRTSPFISTEGEGDNRVITIHQDGRAGRVSPRRAANLPRTVLSSANAAEYPTALLARREMQSWRMLQLEPSALRQPDEFKAPTQLANNGAHLPATLSYLANSEETDPGHIYARAANRLAELLDDVHSIDVERDEKRELLTLFLTGRDGTRHPARSLSDGTLRFMALAVVELDPRAQGLMCLEEPENGIHPERIPVMLRLLQDIAVDPKEPVGSDNPLRQVIVNTHSPAVVSQVPDDSLLVAELRQTIAGERTFMRSAFSPLPDTWRHPDAEGPNAIAKGALLAYLNPVTTDGQDESGRQRLPGDEARRRRVIDRPDFQPYLPTLEMPA